MPTRNVETQTIPCYTHAMGARTLHVGGYSDVGREPTKTRNEDTIGAKKNVFVVADGVSQTIDGDMSSKLAVEGMIREGVQKNGVGFAFSLERIVRRINNTLFLAQRDFLERMEYPQFGTTVTALRLYGEAGGICAEYAHVGDSPLYRGERGTEETLRQMTQDHHLPETNVLSQAVGLNKSINIDWTTGSSVQKGTVFLLCTDGVSRAGTNAERSQLIYRLMKQGRNEEEVARALVEFANTTYGRDNASAIVVRVE